MSKINLFLVAFLAVFSHAVSADIAVSFVEGAPKDRFVINNAGECDFEQLVVKIDLSSTMGKLIFDTTEQGEGVEVFQPFETDDGQITLIGSDKVVDGQTSVDLAIAALSASHSVSFTIDVDDTMKKSELGNIRVSQSEIQGGTVEIEGQGVVLTSAEFGNDAKAMVLIPDC